MTKTPSQTAQSADTANQVECPRCQGQGVLKQWPGDRSPERECDYCNGETFVTEARCESYHDMRKE